ncbi:hypothetical protein HZA76_03010 [Candidatus Roizmanbacteria bacterium]|nr:hypothetical protein [Candidatus Roizmanbacteria bacterium]
MDLNNLFNSFNSGEVINVFFKISSIILAVIYLLYAVVISKQVGTMTKTIEDKFNVVVSLISSIQITVGLILLIFSLFLV